jgi:aryl-alcohol dehydrogenase-like predicted oxidoreductase
LHKIELGKSKIKVSRLIYGTEPFNFKKGPEGNRTQGDKTPKQAAVILKEALDLGVNTWDTSDDYGTHPHVAEALKIVDRKEVVIADKSNALSEEDGWKALEYSRNSLNTDYIDIMFLHIVPSRPMERKDALGRNYYSGTIDERKGALKAWVDAKESGIIRSTALSTHSTEVLKRVLDFPEIDIVCTTLNIKGAVMDDGTLEERINAIKTLKDEGKGIYVIKLLNAGRLRDIGDEAIEWCLQFKDFIDAWNIGMYDISDVKHNIWLFKKHL